MDIEDLDQQLDRLRAAAGRAGANLFELDQSPSVALLDAGPLVGDSARRWDEAKRLLAELFESFTRLSARHRRGGGPSGIAAHPVGLSAGRPGAPARRSVRGAPRASRALGRARPRVGSRTLQRCTADELLASMAQSFDVVRKVVVAAGEAWDDGGPRVQLARERLRAIEPAALELEPPSAGLGSLQPRLDELASILVSDPLAFDVAELDALENRLTALEAEVEAAHETQVGFDDDVEGPDRFSWSSTEAVESARRSHAHVSERVLTSAAVPPVELDALGAELERITALARAGAWRPVSADLPQWRQQVERDRRAVDAVTRRAPGACWPSGSSSEAGSTPTPPRPVGSASWRTQCRGAATPGHTSCSSAPPSTSRWRRRRSGSTRRRCRRWSRDRGRRHEVPARRMSRRDPGRLLRRLWDGSSSGGGARCRHARRRHVRHWQHWPVRRRHLRDRHVRHGTSGTEVLGGSSASSGPWAPPSVGSASSSRSGTVASRRRRLGVGLVEVPRVPARDPATAVMAEPHVAEQRRFCGECNEPVGRSRDDDARSPGGVLPELRPSVLVRGQAVARPARRRPVRGRGLPRPRRAGLDLPRSGPEGGRPVGGPEGADQHRRRGRRWRPRWPSAGSWPRSSTRTS